MFDVDPKQASEGLDGQVAKEDTVQGDGPPETRKQKVETEAEKNARVAREDAQSLADEEHQMEEDNHGLRYAIRPIKDWVLGRIEFPNEIVEEINNHIDNVIIPANKSYAEGLVGQLKQGEKSAQLDFHLTDDIGAQLKTVFDQNKLHLAQIASEGREIFLGVNFFSFHQNK